MAGVPQPEAEEEGTTWLGSLISIALLPLDDGSPVEAGTDAGAGAGAPHPLVAPC